jgi:hypothetical protein
MNYKRLSFLFLLFTFFFSTARAQQVLEEIRNNKQLAGSNYLAYPGPKKSLTAAPKGYKPFYISHYGRHGSRFLINPSDYSRPLQALQHADSLGKLTPLGKDVMHRVKQMSDEAYMRLGELTPLGAEQHRQIATRMYERFPEVFAGDVCIDAKSTIVIRCILSMENALQALLLKNPQLRITHDASEHDMFYMNLRDRKLSAMRHDKATANAIDDYGKKVVDNTRVVSQLFNDTAYVSHNVSPRLGHWLFDLATGLQNTELRRQITLYDLFTDEELYHNWQASNAYWYASYGPSPLTGGQMPYSQRNLLRNIIQQADSCLRLERPGATLRYGHETMVLPLVCLLGLNGYDQSIDDLSQLEARGWINYNIFPMGANVQFIFYRQSPADTDVLFKVLLNEDEATLPLTTDRAPYYHWADFRKHFLDKLNAYQE